MLTGGGVEGEDFGTLSLTLSEPGAIVVATFSGEGAFEVEAGSVTLDVEADGGAGDALYAG